MHKEDMLILKKDISIQYLRALAIISVVTIHVSGNWNSDYGVIIVRQFINFCVGLFLFLSGYLTKNNIKSTSTFYRKRLIRVLIPYIIWSIVFIIKSKNYNISSIILKIFTGQACIIYYYIIVYMQMVLITPILFKFMNMKKGILIEILTPISIFILYFLRYLGIDVNFPYNVLSCSVWIIFYYYGLKVRNLNLESKLNFNFKKNIVIYIIFLVLSIFEGVIWFNLGNKSMAVSQIKITSIFCSIYFIKVIIVLKNKVKFKSKIFKIIGDYSFGIYLTHMIFLSILLKFLTVNNFLCIILISGIIIFLNVIFIFICNKILGEKSWYIGFR